ncbi:MAG: DUF2442 domain-containing protein [Candidatus Sumerlaeota bacterium]|nr:DUF2442 domain-containing protein [Candidatus Sumerlaeota bacterium]
MPTVLREGPYRFFFVSLDRDEPPHVHVRRENMVAKLAIDLEEARARSVAVTDEALTVDLVDGRTIIVPLIWYPRLWHGTTEERDRFEIVGDGAYLHWPDLDEDLTVAGLLAGRRSGEGPQSLKKWLEGRKAPK